MSLCSGIIYSSVNSKLKYLLKEEKIKLPKKFYINLLKFISRLCVYEEEGNKIRPSILLSSNIRSALKQLPNHIFIPLISGKKDGSNLEKIMKAILPFCNNGWLVFLDIHTKKIEYGLLRAFNGPKSLSIKEILFDNDNDELDYSLVHINVLNKFEILFNGIKKNDLLIDFRLVNSNESECNYDIIGEDIVSGVAETSERDILKIVFSNLIKIITQRVHGTIMVIVKKEHSLPDHFFKDGIFLSQPINLTEKALNSVKETRDCVSSEMYYGLSGLLIEMLNIDGITILDNEGNIRAFNVFIHEQGNNKIEPSGGARKRAALAVIDQKNPNYIGVFFQSQDGNTFYERMAQ